MAEGVSVSREENFSEWYTQVIQKAELVDYSAVSGCMVIRPYGFEMWERTVAFLDGEFKKYGVKNASFPLFIPESLLTKEAKHVEGFAPEVAWVTHGGDTKLSERLAVRPTSETIIYDSFKKWIRSHNDLPLVLNQWCNVVRWEFKHPTPFLRTREFLWQEGHTAHATKKSADKEVLDILKIYAKTYEEMLAVPCILGRKSEKEKFAGADYTLSCETFLPNSKAIQACTSHGLGQNFAKAFNITFQNEKGERSHVWTNSWGFSTRSIGMVVMMHGDAKGLIIPPRIAPIQAVIVPILYSDKPDVNKKILAVCKKIKENLDVRAQLDDRDDYTPGRKYNHWELRGVPVRVEVGPKDIDNDQVMFVRRDNGQKEATKIKDAPKRIKSVLESIHRNLFVKAKKFIDDSTVKAKDMKELERAVKNNKLVFIPWCCEAKCEESIKDKTGAKTLNMPLNQEKVTGKCVCGGKAESWIYIAKSY